MNEIRCQRCKARLFDADAEYRHDAEHRRDAGQADPRTALVIVRIKCWRCKTVMEVYLFPKGDRIGVGYATKPVSSAAARRERREAA